LGPPGIIRGKKVDAAEHTIVAVSIRSDDEICRRGDVSSRREGRTIGEVRIKFIRRRGAAKGRGSGNPGCGGRRSARLMKAALLRERNHLAV
jgi:hypothetical protein